MPDKVLEIPHSEAWEEVSEAEFATLVLAELQREVRSRLNSPETHLSYVRTRIAEAVR
jgi:hypothetical protein